MTGWRLSAPVAFLIFNRPDKTRQVFEEIAKAKPPVLLLVADGPRPEKVGEQELCECTRSIVELVNWECDVRTNFSEWNMGCKERISSGLDWVFEEVEEAIILEDDCLPAPSFFRFADELLEKYRYDTRIGMISGNNFQRQNFQTMASYYYSKYGHIWGWATWRRSWKYHDRGIHGWPSLKEQGLMRAIHPNSDESRYWCEIFDAVYDGRIDTWDYQWILALWEHSFLTILPGVNLISNIGFDGQATHTIEDSPLANMSVQELSFPLQHPVDVCVNEGADAYTWNNIYSPKRQGAVRKAFRKVFRHIFKNNT